MNNQHAFELVTERHDHVVELRLQLRAPGYLHLGVVTALADALERLDGDTGCRAIVLSSAGKVFCAGAELGDVAAGADPGVDAFYAQAMRLYRGGKSIVAAVQGPAIGAGMGLALVADFRVAGTAARFCANFCRLGLHPGFGMSVTLPRLVGEQQAARLFYTGQRFDAGHALRIGLVDEVVPDAQVRARALDFAQDIATSAPLAVQSLRATLRQGLADRIAQVNRHERAEQAKHLPTEDFREGVRAMAERRSPNFSGR